MPTGITSVTSGFPLVIVPVLSKTMVLTSLKVWIASPRFINISLIAPIPDPTINAVGVASLNAHGQAITRTATPAKTAAVSVSSPGFNHGKKDEAHKVTDVIIFSWSSSVF